MKPKMKPEVSEVCKINARGPLSLLEELTLSITTTKAKIKIFIVIVWLYKICKSLSYLPLKSRWLKAANENFLVSFLIRRFCWPTGHTAHLSMIGCPWSCPSLPFGLFTLTSPFRFELNGIVCLSMSALCCSAFSHTVHPAKGVLCPHRPRLSLNAT